MFRRATWSLCMVGLVAMGPADQAAAQLSADVPPVAPASRPPLLTTTEGTLMVAALTLAVLTDPAIREDVQETRSPATNDVAHVGNAFGDPRYLVPMLAAGWLIGRAAGAPGMGHAVGHAAVAGLIAAGITGLVKFGLGRTRPMDGGDMDRFQPLSGNAAFPSGHTTVAFAVATALARETPDGLSDVGFYGLASLTALSRLNDDRHWTSDVVAGALVGYLVGRQVVPGKAGGGSGHASLVPTARGLGVSLAF
jgi:membrane-associated phospholipid phosphatase